MMHIEIILVVALFCFHWPVGLTLPCHFFYHKQTIILLLLMFW
jgi:hypothetical protein